MRELKWLISNPSHFQTKSRKLWVISDNISFCSRLRGDAVIAATQSNPIPAHLKMAEIIFIWLDVAVDFVLVGVRIPTWSLWLNEYRTYRGRAEQVYLVKIEMCKPRKGGGVRGKGLGPLWISACILFSPSVSNRPPPSSLIRMGLIWP